VKTEWDYTQLADAYILRPNYSVAAVDSALKVMGVGPGDSVCDVGAGVAHLTMMLADRHLDVVAVEPNDAMRLNGIDRTRNLSRVKWHEGTGEDTGQPDKSYDLVTFGSSFNVCDRPSALRETSRILRADGWFCCLWNHRRLDDPLQSRIESIIRNRVPNYGYGTRRDDQTGVIESSGLYGPVIQVSARVSHMQGVDDCVRAWRSHATLARQAGVEFEAVVGEIEEFLHGLGTLAIEVPYETKVWLAQLR
jgi:ubiquinone/menaquinone biosynthesis C-methylase UbiE